MKKKLLSTLLATAMIASLTACGSNADGSTAVNDSSAAASTNQNGEADSASQGGSSESAGGSVDSIAIGVSGDIQTLVPWTGASEYSSMIYEPLGDRDTFSGDFYGILMESYEQVDETTYDVTIYDYIYDAAGNHITAEDVAFSWNECQRLGELTETRTVESIEAVGEYTVEFKWGTTPALGDFEAQMSNVRIVSQKAYEESGNGMATAPIGTGRYVVTDFSAGISVTIEARDDYWQKEELCKVNAQKAPVKTVRFDVITEGSQIANALQTGTIDVSADVSIDDIPVFEASDNYTVELIDGVQGYVLYPNCSDSSPLADENLRKAVFTAINKTFISQAIQGGACDVLYAMGAKKYDDYDEAWESFAYEYDVEKAKEYLAASAYPNGCELTLITPTMGYNEDVATIIKQQLAEIGITLNIDIQQFSNYIPNEGNPEAWDFTIAFLSSNDYITNCWAKYFDIDNVGTGLTKNFVYDEELQRLIDTCTSVEGHTPENNTACWSYVMEKAYCCPLIIPQQSVVYNSSKIGGVAYSGADKILVSGFEIK
ncbi:MAG: ABC transporter substrate-binding protein [Lachnospiraceae bacterium]|nr:ABC transporter substrate-binding protein [Lachnospiraceae bacterium]